MRVAQRLYENGYITYMRTDSTNLSETALTAARAQARELYGDAYVPAEARHYSRKVKNAQEAHEAIRPAGDTFRTPGRAGRRLSPRRVPAVRADLAAHARLADGRRGRHHRLGRGSAGTLGGRRARPSSPPSGRTITFPGFLRAYVEDTDDAGRRGRRRARAPAAAAGRGDAARRRARSSRPGTRPARRPATPRLAGQGAGGARHRPAVHLRLDHADHPGPRLRLEEGPALVPSWMAFAVIGLLEQHFAPAGRLRLHRLDGGRPRRRSPTATARGSTGCAEFYFGAATPSGAERRRGLVRAA